MRRTRSGLSHMYSIIKRSDIVARVPERWAKQYKGYVDNGDRWDKGPTTKALLDLKPGFSAEEVDTIIGNDSWTKNCCDECGKDCDVLLRMGQEPDYDARWLDLCERCLREGLFQLEKVYG